MTGISTLGQALDQVERFKTIQSQLATLQNQVASGKKTQLFKGLETDVLISKRARANVKMLDNFNRNIDIADRRLKLMSNAVDSIRNQAGNLINALNIQTQQGEFEMESIADLASKTRDFLVSLMNEKDGPRFLFGGAETVDTPLTDTGTLDTYLQTQINDWVNSNITTDELITSYRDKGQLNDTIMGYSAPLSSGTAKGVFVRVEENTEIDYTVFANNDGFRDILAVTGMMENLDLILDEVTLEADDPLSTVTAPGATQQEQNDNFYRMFNDLSAMLNNALDKLENVSFDLSQSQAQIHEIQEGHKLEKNILLDNISEVEDVDVNEAAVQLNSLQIQLEASFRITASISQLRLANFLPV